MHIVLMYASQRRMKEFKSAGGGGGGGGVPGGFGKRGFD